MTKKQKFHLPLRAYLLYLVLISFMLTGVTFSKYVTSSYSSDSARVARLGELYITENGTKYDGEVKWNIVPGVDITKNAVLHFGDSELACYVFFEVETTGFVANGKDYSYGELLKFRIADGWDSFNSNGSTVYYIAAEPGRSIDKEVFADGGKITVSKDLTASEIETIANSISITVNATAVQCGGFDSAESAYNAVK